MSEPSLLGFLERRRGPARARLAFGLGAAFAGAAFVAACGTGELSLGQNALSGSDAAAGDGGGGADGGECRPIPPLSPDVCAVDERVVSHLDDRGCWLSYECQPNDQDGGPAPDADVPPCPTGRGQCVGISPTSCPDGVFAPSDVASCGGGIGVGCCVSCPQIVAPNCPPDRPTVKPDKDAYGCTVGAICIKTFSLGDADSGASIAAKEHDALSVTLTENGSTGYQWSVSQPGGLPAATEQITPGAKPGDAGTHAFAWNDLTVGSHAVTLIYKRPFETTPTSTFTFTVTVTP